MKLNIDNILSNVLVILLIAISSISVIMLEDYVGYVSYHQAEGGVISEVNIHLAEDAKYWNGVYGIVIGGIMLNNTWMITATNAGMSYMNLIVPCLEKDIEHEVYASHVKSDEIDWQNVVAADPAVIDTWLGLPSTDPMSANRTFSNTMTITVGNRTVTNIPSTYTKQAGVPGSTLFQHGLITDGTNFIVVAKIIDSYIPGFNPNAGPLNYQMFVPVRNGEVQLYYLYTDPFDICPEGQEEEKAKGTVYGWVTDANTSLPLQDAFVYLGNDFAVTDADGYYNVSAQAGNYKIIGLKDGYLPYIGNVTVVADTSVEHNFSMEVTEEVQEGTGTGQGTTTGGGDVGPDFKSKTDSDRDKGPSFAPSVGPYVEKPEEPGIDHFISLDRLFKRIRIGNYFVEHLIIFNFRDEPVSLTVELTGNSSEILEIDKTELVIEANEYDNITIRGFGKEIGTYTGKIRIDGDFNDTLPVEIIVTDEDKLPVEALLMQLEVLTGRPGAGKKFKFKVNLHNLLVEEKFNVSLDYRIRGVESATANYSMSAGNDSVELLTALSLINEVVLPKEWPKGDYFLMIDAYFLDLYSQAATVFTVYEPIYMYSVFGIIRLWQLLLILIIIALLILAFILIRRHIESKKRFHAKVEYKQLPPKGPRTIYVGKIAETERDTYFDMDKLTVHSIVAGSTGGGKTISAQVIVEECLMKDTSVVVFDPTAQWTGMLRKCVDEKMISFYPRFHLTKKDAKAFSGNIRAIKDAREKIDLNKYWKPGEIQVFTTNTLDPHDIDIFVANTVREVFHSNLQEYRGLRMLMVYDEVHRLLPKFGGSGEGFIQIERACREFRKWGIGVMLVSQVLADFVGQIKANINTEVQMKTRDEGDLKRIETKYGKEYIQALVKAPVGSGMVQNSAWNRGKPYYVTFRPILHSVKRLSDEELEEYNKYNGMVDDLQYQLEQLEAEGIDVFDLKLELKLALDKIKSGNFNMVGIYVEGLKPRIEKHWTELGKTPKKRTIELVSEDDIKEALNAAKEEREKLQAEKGDEKKDEAKEDKPLGFSDDVPPDKLLKLANGMLVINLKSLYDELAAMKDDDFNKQVNDEKSDFADWIRTACKNPKLAKIAEKIATREDFMKFLEMAEKGKEKEFKPSKTRQVKKEEKKDDKKASEKKDEKKPPEKKEEQPPEQQQGNQQQENKEQQPQEQQQNQQEQQQNQQPPQQEQPQEQNQQQESVLNKQVGENQQFILTDGTSLKSMKDLLEKLKVMDDGMFLQYVTDNKNDFASWIEHVIQHNEIAGKFNSTKNKQDMINILESYK